MMAEQLAEALAASDTLFGFDGLLGLAKRLQVSPDALAHHLENMTLIDEATRDGLLAQLANRPFLRKKGTLLQSHTSEKAKTPGSGLLSGHGRTI